MKISRVERRKQDTRQRIAHAALELFAKQGIDATTIAEISEAADIGKGTFFTYFPTKEAVLADIGTLMLALMSEGVEATEAVGAGPRARLEQLLVPGLEWHQKHPALSRLSIDVLMRSDSALDADAANIDALHGLLVSLVSAGQAKGEFRSTQPPEAGATALLGLYFITLHRWHARKAQGSVVEQFKAGLDVLLQGLAT